MTPDRANGRAATEWGGGGERAIGVEGATVEGATEEEPPSQPPIAQVNNRAAAPQRERGEVCTGTLYALVFPNAPTAAPEPTSLVLLGTGAAGWLAKTRRRSRWPRI